MRRAWRLHSLWRAQWRQRQLVRRGGLHHSWMGRMQRASRSHSSAFRMMIRVRVFAPSTDARNHTRALATHCVVRRTPTVATGAHAAAAWGHGRRHGRRHGWRHSRRHEERRLWLLRL